MVNTEGQQQIWLQNCPSDSSSCPNNFTQSLLNEDSEYQHTHRWSVCVFLRDPNFRIIGHLVQVMQDNTEFVNSTKHTGIQRKYKLISLSSEHQSCGKISCYIKNYVQSYGSIHLSMFTAFFYLFLYIVLTIL